MSIDVPVFDCESDFDFGLKDDLLSDFVQVAGSLTPEQNLLLFKGLRAYRILIGYIPPSTDQEILRRQQDFLNFGNLVAPFGVFDYELCAQYLVANLGCDYTVACAYVYLN